MSSRYLCCGYGSGIRQCTYPAGNIETYCWDGYSFAPSFCYQGWSNSSFYVNTPSLRNPHTNYDHTNVYPGTETVFHWTFFCYCDCFCGGMCHLFYDPIGSLVSFYYYSYNSCSPPGYYNQNWFWAGWGVNNTSCLELWINGQYCSCVCSSTSLPSFTQYACVCCLDVARTTHICHPGTIWVEGENIWFVGGMCWAQCVKHDGSSTFVGTADAGSIWIGTGNYLEYVDASGYKRRTHVGDPYGIGGQITCGCCDVGTANKGYIWVRSNWAFIFFVNCSGKIVRLGNGFQYGNGP